MCAGVAEGALADLFARAGGEARRPEGETAASA
jgi:hypothetical protein